MHLLNSYANGTKCRHFANAPLYHAFTTFAIH
jgi:hypothetical protein